MTDRNIFEAYITLPSDSSILLMESLSIIHRYGKVELMTNDKGRVYYKANINELLEHNITEEDITKLRNSSWKIDGELLIKDL